MQQTIASITLLVRDYDEAIAFFTQKLSFTLVEDTPLDEQKRWVRVTPPQSTGTSVLLAKASTPAQLAAVGRQAGERVFLFLHTDDLQRDYAAMRAAGVTFHEAPRREGYGTVAVFEDLYGNLWDLLQPTD
jgi:catechol 2,3-dioxygenase-like lactoylglutathione lyase family enzyme